MSRPIIPLLLSFMAGITCGFMFVVPELLAQLFLSIFLLVVLSLLIAHKWKYLTLFVILSLFCLGILEMNLSLRPPQHKQDHISHFLTSEKTTVEGIICNHPQISPEKTDIIVSVSRMMKTDLYLPVSGLILLSIRDAIPLRYGDVIRFKCRLRIPHNFQNPGAFDHERYLRLAGIEVRGFIDDQANYIVIRRGAGNLLRSALERYRENIRQVILQESPGTEGKIILAMLLGDQKEIPKEIMEQFNKTGTTHIIAISGFNIGIVALFCLFVVRFLLKTSQYSLLRWDITILSSVCAIAFVILYSFIAGAGISVLRASIMVGVFLAATWVDRERDHYNTLALAALFILIVSPHSLFDVSFQLSFMAVYFILFLTPRMMAFSPSPVRFPVASSTGKQLSLPYIRKAMRIALTFFLVSLSATLGTLPLIILYFNRVSLVGIAANLVVVPILGVIAIPIFLLIILAVPLSTSLAGVIIGLSEMLVRISLALVGILADFPWSSLYVSTPTFYEIGAYYLLLFSVGFFLDGLISSTEPTAKGRNLRPAVIGLAVITFFVFHSIYLYLNDLYEDRLSVTAVDVGQGSATLIRFPSGKTMLVDGGGFFDETFDVGKYVLAPFLWHERINKIDIIVLTHPHPDHLQGLLFIMDNFHVREVWTNGQKVNTLLYGTFRQTIRDRGIDLKVVSDQTQEVIIAQVGIRIFNPEAINQRMHLNKSSRSQDDSFHGYDGDLAAPLSNYETPKSAEINDHSIVMRLSFQHRTFLLTGDIGEKTESRIIHSDADLQSDVLFLPHHGGFRSSSRAFLDRVKPQVAVISCGFDNIFRDPHPDVLRRLQSLQTSCYRTDLDGAVRIETDGVNLKITPFRKS